MRTDLARVMIMHHSNLKSTEKDKSIFPLTSLFAQSLTQAWVLLCRATLMSLFQLMASCRWTFAL